MQHLDTDRLAALADERPTAAEAEHLATCLLCRGERDAYVALLALAQREGAAHATATSTPLTSWDTLSTALREEGLVRSAPDVVRSTAFEVRPLWASTSFWRRAAASVALLVGGAAIGRASAPRVAPSTVAASIAVEPPAIEATSGATASAEPSAGISATIPVYGEPATDAQLASRSVGGVGFAGPTEALQALTRAQQQYQRAAAYLAEHDSSTVAGTPQALRARLAALDEVMPKVREALYEAPQDPVLNQYYLTTYDVRESTLRQLGRALPVGVRLNSY